ncbi:MAG: LrgB family protein [Pseudomonadales bacterium]|nr:LrgB family protein [Pseudomonadales bacterium]
MWLPITIAVYLAADTLQQRLGWLVLQPMLTSVLILIPLLLLSGQGVATYRQATAPLVWVAGPLTVGMAVPLFGERRRIMDAARPLMITLGIGSLLASGSAFALACLFHLGAPVDKAFLTRAISLPFCLPVSHLIGAPSGLAAVIVGISGLLGGIAAPILLPKRWSESARGVSMGLAAHGIGTAVGLRLSVRTGAYAALGMMLNGLLTSLWLPWIWQRAAHHIGF